MDVDAFLDDLRRRVEYAGQIVHVRDVPARAAELADPAEPLGPAARQMLAARGIERLYRHQAQAVDAVRDGRNVLVVTGTASGKSLCYQVPLVEQLAGDTRGRALLLFPTKALCQDQFRSFNEALQAAGLTDVAAGVYDGDTPSGTRRRLRDEARAIFTNPDMLHAALMPQHGRWAGFLADLRLIVLDEMHVYSGIFGSNMANLFRRFWRLCGHYGCNAQVIACSATIGNPLELARGLTGRATELIDVDGSPHGRRTYVFWNPPRIRGGNWRSRRSANVEAHELMAELVQRGAATITFSKAKMTAEMIHRYVCQRLRETAPGLERKVSPYRGGYLPHERREIERRLFRGELLGVSTTRALELGIDVGALEASILVGYPGTLAGFFQQAGRAGRRDRDALTILIGLDTSINQYVMTNPDHIFGRAIERAVLDVDNPYVVLGHLRCAAQELPLCEDEVAHFGPTAPLALRVLEENLKLHHVGGRWYHASVETPQHEVSLRDYADANVVIHDADSGAVLGEVNKFDAQPILHPGAIYMHQGETYLVGDLDLERNLATVRRVDVDYYTQPKGGTDVHHVDHRLREKPFGAGMAYWGEVTAYFRTWGYEKIHFYELDAISQHEVDLPTYVLETLAVWLVPPEDLMADVRRADLDAHSGLRGIGYATRMLLPLFMTCDTLDFSHTIGSANSEWNAIFIYERYPLGLGFTETAYQRLGEIMPAVRANIHGCPCEDGCPCCVGKPLRPYTTWNVERGEASIPSKAAAMMILDALLAGGELDRADTHAVTDSPAAMMNRLERNLRRRLERMREPQVFHPIEPNVTTAHPDIEEPQQLSQPDVAERARRRGAFDKALHKRLAKRIRTHKLSAHAAPAAVPPGMRRRGTNKPPTHFPGRPADDTTDAHETDPVELGDSLAARARKLAKKRKKKP